MSGQPEEAGNKIDVNKLTNDVQPVEQALKSGNIAEICEQLAALGKKYYHPKGIQEVTSSLQQQITTGLLHFDTEEAEKNRVRFLEKLMEAIVPLYQSFVEDGEAPRNIQYLHDIRNGLSIYMGCFGNIDCEPRYKEIASKAISPSNEEIDAMKGTIAAILPETITAYLQQARENISEYKKYIQSEITAQTGKTKTGRFLQKENEFVDRLDARLMSAEQKTTAAEKIQEIAAIKKMVIEHRTPPTLFERFKEKIQRAVLNWNVSAFISRMMRHKEKKRTFLESIEQSRHSLYNHSSEIFFHSKAMPPVIAKEEKEDDSDRRNDGPRVS